MRPVRTGLTTATLSLVGWASAGALVALAVTGRPGALVPAALPAAFLVAGTVGGRARPDSRGVQLLLGVGALHLLAFTVGGWLATGTADGTTDWALALLALAAYGAGFVSLALLLATYPTGRPSSRSGRVFALLAPAVLVVVVAKEALLSPAAPMVLGHGPAAVPAPGPLPLVDVPLDVQPVLPLLVVAGAGLLVARARRADAVARRQLEWATLAGIVLATLLLATPAASAVLPDPVWTCVFVTAVSGVPFALLGGMVRHRLLDVDVLVVRTVARGLLVVAVLTCFAAAALLLGRAGSATAAVVLTCVAALTGRPLLSRAEAAADRWVTGGRVRRGALMSELGATLVRSDPEQLPEHLCDTVREALDVSWVRLVLGHRLSLARELLPPAASAAPALRAAQELARDALADLRRLVAGIHPATVASPRRSRPVPGSPRSL